MLQSDPEQFEQLKEDYAYAQQTQRDARQQAFALAEVVQRGPTSATLIRRKCSAATAISTKNCANVWNRRKRTQPRARRDARAHAAQLSQYNPGAGFAEEFV